jgi:hypothetical protein
LFIANSDCDFALMAKRTVFVSATNMILPLNTSGEWYVDLNWNGKGVCINGGTVEISNRQLVDRCVYP